MNDETRTDEPAASPEGLTEVSRSHRPKRLHEHGLVLQSMGIPYQAVQAGGEGVLLVGTADASRATEQLALYDRENRGWPRVEELPEVLGQGAVGVAVWVAILVACYVLERHHAFDLDWWDSGKSIAALMRDSEPWRALTSLTLHDDLQHLASNLVFGALFLAIACQVLGTGLALSAVFLSGALGNYVNAWLQRPDFSAIGASTAVFGALGVLGGQRWQSRSRLGMSRRLIPLIACVALFGWYGLGGERPERVDVVGHLCGFVAGVVLGFAQGRWGARLHPGPRGQTLLALATVAALALAWSLALGP